MNTIVDPAGTPSVIYNRGGTTIQTIIGSGSTPTNLTSFSETSVYFIKGDPLASPAGLALLVLPSGADIGNTVEFYMNYDAGTFGRATANISAAAGDTIADRSGLTFSSTNGFILRKISSTDWAVLGVTGL